MPEFSKEELKKVFKGKKSLTGSDIRTLERWGFQISRSKNHLVLAYRNRNYVIAKTSSDWRAGQNLVSIIWNGINRAA